MRNFILISMLISAVIFFIGLSLTQTDDLVTGDNVKVVDGVQYVTIRARGGYFPRISEAQAGMPTVLKMETAGQFDCSLALVLPSLNQSDMLELNSIKEVEIGTFKDGDKFRGLCSMGMYGFEIRFVEGDL